MKRIVLTWSLLAFTLPALAAEGAATATAGDPMAGWMPPKVKKEAQDKKEIMALFAAMQAAEKKGDLDAAASLVDFPVLMVTDDSKGQAMGETWTREKWTQVMEPFYKRPMPAEMKITHKPAVFLMSDSLASVDDAFTMSGGGKKVSGRNSTLLVRRDGKWLVKAMVEGGWGDMMGNGPATASQPAPAAGTATGTGSGGPQDTPPSTTK